MSILKGTRPTIRQSAKVAKFLWPNFVSEHGCVFVGDQPGFNPPPSSDTATCWESFANHTHIFDEFRNNATRHTAVGGDETLTEIEGVYDEFHPDFIAACEFGRHAALLWALKLKMDFPSENFRVYYTEYDNPIIRFHKVREGEAPWLSDEMIATETHPDFRNALVYETARLPIGVSNRPPFVQ